MADKLKSLIKNLPSVEPPRSVEEALIGVIKRQLIWLWERRLSILAGGMTLIFGFLTIKQMLILAHWLGTGDFWRLLSWDRAWVWQEPVSLWQAFLAANPLKEVIFLLFLLAVLIYSLQVLMGQGQRRKEIYSLLVLLALLGVGLSVGWRLLIRPVPVPSSKEIESTEPAEQKKTVTPSVSQPIQSAFFLQLSSPQDKMTVKTDQILVAGRTLPGAEVFINEYQITPRADGGFSFNLPLVEGENPILISAGSENGDQEIELTVYYELP